MGARMIEEGEGVRAARAAKRRFLRTAGLSLLGAVGIGVVMILGKTAPGHITPAAAVIAVVAMAILLPVAIYFNVRATDEHDQMIGLHANSFGLYVYFFVQWAWLVLWGGGLVPAPNGLAICLVTALATLGRYFQLKHLR